MGQNFRCYVVFGSNHASTGQCILMVVEIGALALVPDMEIGGGMSHPHLSLKDQRC